MSPYIDIRARFLPEIAVILKFAEWTDEDRLSAPVFMGLETGVGPESMRRET